MMVICFVEETPKSSAIGCYSFFPTPPLEAVPFCMKLLNIHHQKGRGREHSCITFWVALRDLAFLLQWILQFPAPVGSGAETHVFSLPSECSYRL